MFDSMWKCLLICLPLCFFGVGPLPIGNFSVPVVSQIAPLIAFGQLLIGEKAQLVQFAGSYTQEKDSSANWIMPNAIYGIRNDLSLFFAVPYNLHTRVGSAHSSGIKDIVVQLEYGLYGKTRSDYTLQATLVGNIQFPTGSFTKIPPNGTGSFSYFVGTTFAYTSYNWYAFVSPGANLTTSHHGTKFGNSYLYQCGFARYIDALSPPGWIFDLMVEFDGTYVERDEIGGVTNPNSGGNALLVTPSLWFSSKRLILQAGAGFPLFQELNGHQDKISYEIAYNLGLAFQF